MITKSGRKWARRGLCLAAVLCLMWVAVADEPPAAEETAEQVTEAPTAEPTAAPTEEPTGKPTDNPEEALGSNGETPAESTADETQGEPRMMDTPETSDGTTDERTGQETDGPAGQETDAPSEQETDGPAGQETNAPSEQETDGPAGQETDIPAGQETDAPAGQETDAPAGQETDELTGQETNGPAGQETDEPTGQETTEPTQSTEPTEDPEEEIDEDPEHFVYTDDSRETVTAYTGGKRRIRIPDGVKYIGEEAFKGNKQLDEVYLPDTVEEIRDEAFSGCTNLRIIGFNIENPPARIGSKAFHDCWSLIRDIKDLVEEVAEEVAEDAFDETTQPPVTDPPTPTPEPEDEDEDEDWDEDWEEDVEWETTTITSTSGKKSTKVSAPKHARSGPKMLHDYDQVLVGGGETAPMQELTLGGEKLALSLKGENEEPAMFTAAFAVGNAFWDGKADSLDNVDTLMLRAAAESGNRWFLDGTLLRQLNKTGIDYIMFRDGTGDVIVPTEGFLAGWEYEEMRRKGVAGRKFEYTLIMGELPEWIVTVEGKAYEISEDSLAPIYLTGVTMIPKGSERDLRAEMENGI